MNSFTYVEPADVNEALDALTNYGEDAKLIAGGTGLINLMKQQLVQPAYLIGLRRIKNLNQVNANGGLSVGGLTTLRTLETSPAVLSQAPLLAEAIRMVATIRIRTAATIGGAVAHADPNQDTPPALIALDARVRVRSKAGTREIPIDQFFIGYYETVIRPDEIVTEVIIPPQPEGNGSAFIKYLPQTHDDYATVAVAARIAVNGGKISDARIALGAAASTPLRATAVEDALLGKAPSAALLSEAAAKVADIVDPTADFRGSSEYKRDMAVVFVRRTIEQALTRAGHKLA